MRYKYERHERSSSSQESIEFDRFGREIVHLDLETWVHPTCGKTLIFPEGEVPSFCRFCNRDIEPIYMVELNENLYRLRQLEEDPNSTRKRSNKNDGWSRLICYIIGWFALMSIGGAIFHHIEEPHYHAQKNRYLEEVDKIKNTVNETHFQGVMDLCERYHRLPRHNIWHFEGATFFSITVATTVGYGAHAPQTDEGKIAFMVFSIISISITALTVRQLLSVLGKCFRRSERFFYKERQLSLHQVHFLWMCFTTIVLVIIFIAQAKLYEYNNGWSSLQSTYFLWTTFTTVGIGDVIPQEFLSEEGVAEHALPLLIAIAFLPVWMWSVLNWMYILFVKITFPGTKTLPSILEEAGLRLLENGQIEKEKQASRSRTQSSKREQSRSAPRSLGNSKTYYEENMPEGYRNSKEKMIRIMEKHRTYPKTTVAGASERLLTPRGTSRPGSTKYRYRHL